MNYKALVHFCPNNSTAICGAGSLKEFTPDLMAGPGEEAGTTCHECQRRMWMQGHDALPSSIGNPNRTQLALGFLEAVPVSVH